jgi:serine protease Do
MFDLNGKVIGINSAIFTTAGANGVGFALPSNIANWVTNQLLQKGKVHRGWLGMEFAIGVDKYTGKEGFVITSIEEESNAYKEGLRVGDIITKYNDHNAEDLNTFIQFVEQLDLGQALRVKVLNSGMEVKSIIRVQEMPLEALKEVTNKALVENTKALHQDEDKNIFYISELNIAVKDAYPRGLRIMKLERGSPLYGKGIKEGDIILEADREDIYSPDNLLDSIHNAALDDFRPISLLIQSINETFYTNIEVKLEND